MSSLTKFTNKYSKQLTIKNELIPVGKTLENIKENGLIDGDEQLNENYQKAKIIVDDFLRDFINCLPPINRAPRDSSAGSCPKFTADRCAGSTKGNINPRI